MATTAGTGRAVATDVGATASWSSRGESEPPDGARPEGVRVASGSSAGRDTPAAEASEVAGGRTVIPAGGHGPPPAVRGSPRRNGDASWVAAAAGDPCDSPPAPAAGAERTPASSEAGVVATAAGVTGTGADAAAAVRPATGGHGSPPGSRGRPRRTATPSAEGAPGTPPSGIEPPAAVDPGRIPGVSARAEESENEGASPTGASPTDASPTDASPTGASAAASAATSPAGGQGSPPGTRGSPRRSRRPEAAIRPSSPRGRR